MVRGIYVAASGMRTQVENQDVIANNLANADTPGFKKDTLMVGSFPQFLIQRIDDVSDEGRPPVIGSFSLGSEPAGVATDFSSGGIVSTQRNLDFAISGRGFFVIQTPQGTRYTRAGSFTRSSDGLLVTTEGYPVLGENGRIDIGDGEFSVSSAGDVIVDGQVVNRISVVDIAPAELVKEGDSLFAARQGAGVTPAEGYSVLQGYLESSNVNIVQEMVKMITGLRAYEANQKVLKMEDETLGKLINEGLRV